MADYNKYQKMIINTLARKLGPAAEDFAQDMASKAGTRFENISNENVERFALRVEENALKYISEAEAKFVANTIRKLRA